MSLISKSKVVLIFLVILMSATITFAGPGPCGLYLKHTRTQALPYSGVYFDRAVDLNNDGFADLLASQSPNQSSYSRTRTFMLPNLGNGQFGTPTVFIQPPAANPVYSNYDILNINNDAHRDVILWYGSLSEQFIVGINNGNGAITYGPLTTISQVGRMSGFFDVNEDGINDWLGWSDNPSLTSFYSPGNGDGTFDPPVALFDHFAAYGVADFNGDGKTDLLDGQHLHLNQGGGTFGTLAITNPFVPSETVWGSGDFNSDGRTDFLVGPGNYSLTFSTLIGTGTGFTRTTYNIAGGQSYIGIPSAMNVSGNAATDIVFHPRDRAETIVFTNDGAGNFTTNTYKGRFFPRTEQTTVIADFDNDGKLDQVRGTSATSNSKIMLRDVTSFTFLKNVCTRPGQTRIVDFDHSQTTDWSFWRPSSGDWIRLTNSYNSGPSIGSGINFGLGSLGDIPTPGDFDGDGETDPAVFRNSTGVWYARRSSDFNWYVLPFGSPGDKPVVGDYDGDTISDVAVFRPSDGNWYIWYTGSQNYSIVRFGLEGDKPAPADYDGDLKTDIAVFRPSTGVWYILTSSNGGFIAHQWGTNGDQPMSADFDGDGKADITVFRPSNQFAYILRSTNSTVTYYQAGVMGSIPQIGDWDGDFVADIGAYSPEAADWWTSAFLIVAHNFGGPGTIPTSSLVRME